MLPKEKGKLPSGFKTREEYNAYMRKYRADIKARAQAYGEIQQAPVNQVKRAIKEKPQTPTPNNILDLNEEEALHWLYRNYLATVDYYAATHKWDYDQRAHTLHKIVERLGKIATQEWVVQFTIILKTIVKMCETLFTKDIPEDHKQQFRVMLDHMVRYQHALVAAKRKKDKSFTWENWVV